MRSLTVVPVVAVYEIRAIAVGETRRAAAPRPPAVRAVRDGELAVVGVLATRHPSANKSTP